MKYDLSVLIPARNEMFLKNTVEDILKNKEGQTEVIVGLDGQWSDPPIEDHPDVTIIYHNESIGQRATINEACRLSKAKYVMKCDAHVAFDKGFDVKMMAEMKDNYTMVPRLYNLHAFDWKCNKCGNKWYQGPTPKFCCSDGVGKVKNEVCDNTTDFERIMVWEPRLSRKTDHMRFDKDLKFQYWGAFKDRSEAQGDIVDTMSLLGACWMLTREKYWELNICGEEHGSWGQQGTEVACKTWLSGGRLVTNKKTWYSHMFRTQGGDFGFPFPISGRQVENARRYSRELWRDGTWEKAIHPLSWLIQKFYPVPGWTDQDLAELKENERKHSKTLSKPTKGIIYYTDNQVKLRIGNVCRKYILRAGLPIVSASLKPMNFGKNIHVPLKRGYEAYFTQILTALENSEADIIYFCEHDWLYHPSHFEFTPPAKDTFYYNWNWWRIRSSDGYSIKYDTQLLPGICAYRELLLEYYRKQFNLLKSHSFDTPYVMKTGFEPGTHHRVPELSGYKSDKWFSEYPNIDIRHSNNLTSSKWAQDAFRSQKNCRGWTETDNIPSWGKTKEIIKLF